MGARSRTTGYWPRPAETRRTVDHSHARARARGASFERRLGRRAEEHDVRVPEARLPASLCGGGGACSAAAPEPRMYRAEASCPPSVRRRRPPRSSRVARQQAGQLHARIAGHADDAGANLGPIGFCAPLYLPRPHLSPRCPGDRPAYVTEPALAADGHISARRPRRARPAPPARPRSCAIRSPA